MSYRIGVDVDGVLADFVSSYKKKFIETTGRDSFTNPWVSWDHHKSCGYTGTESTKVWDQIKSSENFWETLTPYQETAEVMANLLGRTLKGDDVYFITIRPSKGAVSAKAQTEMWLQDMAGTRLFIPTVLITERKGDAAKLLNLTHYIDDKWENCVDVEVSTDETEVYLLDRPWNQEVSDNWIQRVPSVMDMLKELD